MCFLSEKLAIALLYSFCKWCIRCCYITVVFAMGASQKVFSIKKLPFKRNQHYSENIKNSRFFTIFYHRAAGKKSNTVMWCSGCKIHRYVAAPCTRIDHLSTVKTGPKVVFFPDSGHMAGNLLLCLGLSSTTTVLTCSVRQIVMLKYLYNNWNSIDIYGSKWKYWLTPTPFLLSPLFGSTTPLSPASL